MMITMITMMMMMMTPHSPTIEEGQVSVQHCQSQYWKFNIEKRRKENIEILEIQYWKYWKFNIAKRRKRENIEIPKKKGDTLNHLHPWSD